MSHSKIIPIGVAKQFIERLMARLDVDQTHAKALAEVLVAGDYRGHFSHGLNRIGITSSS